MLVNHKTRRVLCTLLSLAFIGGPLDGEDLFHSRCVTQLIECLADQVVANVFREFAGVDVCQCGYQIAALVNLFFGACVGAKSR